MADDQEAKDESTDHLGVFDMTMPPDDVDMVKEKVAEIMKVVYETLKDRTGKASEDISKEMAEGFFPILLDVYSRGAFRSSIDSKTTIIDMTTEKPEEEPT